MIVDDSIELALLRRRKAELLKQKILTIKNDGLVYYKPHAKQDSFHRSTAKRRGYFAGNRSGKSHAGCAEDAAWLRGERSWLHVDDPARRSAIPQHPTKGLVITTNWDKVDEVYTSNRGNEGKLWKFLPRDGFIKRTTRNHEGKICIVECSNGSVLRFATVRSWLNDPQSVESTDYDFIHVDEPCPEGLWIGASRGLMDRDGYAWFTLTALSEPWLTDAFLPGGMFERSCFKVEGSIYDNPYISTDAIKLFEDSLSDEEKECRLFGKPMHLAGLVYKEFQYDKHVIRNLPKGWRSSSEPPKEWPVYYAIDPHPRTPHCVLFVTVDPRGKLYVFNDIFEHCNVGELCVLMKKTTDGKNLIRGIADPLAFIEVQTTEMSWSDDFALNGFPVEKGVKDPMRGISRVKELLVHDPPMLLFTESARRTLYEIQRWFWNEDTNKPVDKDDHAMENLYRLVLDEPCWVDYRSYNRVIGDVVIDKPLLDLDSVSLKI